MARMKTGPTVRPWVTAYTHPCSGRRTHASGFPSRLAAGVAADHAAALLPAALAFGLVGADAVLDHARGPCLRGRCGHGEGLQRCRWAFPVPCPAGGAWAEWSGFGASPAAMWAAVVAAALGYRGRA